MQAKNKIINLTVIVSALGYFVDIYDLVLFSIVRVPSLKSLGIPDDQLLSNGVHLINMQMIGMLIGGIIWGIIGDKRGRISVLFGSILLYSLANIANAFVTDVTTYGILRFIAGIGLAGELGAAITLVSEVMPKETRGYATSIVAGVGVSGAILANLVAKATTWQTAYIVGGVLGLLLLIMRVRMMDSGIYEKVRTKAHVTKGAFLSLFTNGDRLRRYLCCIFIGVPIWYVIGILVTFSPEITKALGATDAVSAGDAIMFTYAGLTVGDIGSGVASQWLKSRRKIVFWFIVATAITCAVYLLPEKSSDFYYGICFFMGLAVGYWAVFVSIAAEQFGTNLRATAAITVPNFVRGAVVPLTLSFRSLQETMGVVQSAVIIGVVVIVLALISLHFMKETFAKDLDFVEH